MNNWSEFALPNASTRVLPAKSNNQSYEISVWCPADADQSQCLPVIYVLDGHDFFATWADSVHRLSRRPAATNVGPAIIVAVTAAGSNANTQRYVDFTPGPPAEETISHRDTGGAEAFHAFLREELIPLIENDFPADPERRILFGHSLAGFFTLHTLAIHPESFATYIAVSPSIWWDQAALHTEIEQLAPLKPKYVSISVGEWEGQLPPWQKQQHNAEQVMRRRARRAMIERAQETAADLENTLGRDHVAFQQFPDEDHGSVVLVAIARALRFALGDSAAADADRTP